MTRHAGLFDGVQPYASAWLEVGDGHSLYYEQCGIADGLPVLFLHGGPGSGCSARHRGFFDPGKTRTVLFDQRGCGRSRPLGSLANNNTDALVLDIERLRQHLGIERWLVFGGSWGSSLALAYAVEHPQACLGLLLRGLFPGRASDHDWFFHGAAQVLPDAWDALASLAPQVQPADLLRWYCDTVLGQDERAGVAAAALWSAWDNALMERRWTAAATPPAPPSGESARQLLGKYRVQAHFMRHECFFQERPLLDRVRSQPALHKMPVAMLHGRLDWVCRPQAAWDLHLAMPNSRLRWIDGAGHSQFEPAMAQALVDAVAHFVERRDFKDWPAPA